MTSSCLHLEVSCKPVSTNLAETIPVLPRLRRDSNLLEECPVFKKGEKHLPSNYRPVSLISIACKVLEHIVHSSVMDHFDRHKILTDNQHDFRAKRSCESQFITTIQKIVSTMSTKGQMDVILLDFAKAFDKVPYQRLLHKLDYYGMCNSTLHWIESFLHQRKQSVLLDGAESSEADLLSGVPQGRCRVRSGRTVRNGSAPEIACGSHLPHENFKGCMPFQKLRDTSSDKNDASDSTWWSTELFLFCFECGLTSR